MPLYDFKCSGCGAEREILVASNCRWRKCVCSRRMERQFPTSFSALNTESVNGEKFKGLEMALGERPVSVRHQEELMKKTGCYPANSEYHAAAPATPRKEITEKELYETLNS